jgi:TIR domain
MQIVETSLVEYFESCRSDLIDQGAHVLILALVRDADAPSFYADLTRYWDSINDVTGRHVVFAVAGSSAAQDIGHGSVHGRGYCEQMTVARPGTYDIDVLRGLAGPRRKVEPYLGNIAEANTGQISALCEHLGVLEQDLPCLHLTYLRTGRSLILSQAALPGTTVYTACKAIAAHLQRSLRAFDQAGKVEGADDLPKFRDKQERLEFDLKYYRRRLADPNFFSRGERKHDPLAAYLHQRLAETPEITPIELRELIAICENPNRRASDKTAAVAIIDGVAATSYSADADPFGRRKRKINRLVDRARRLVAVAFSPAALDYEDPGWLAQQQERRSEIAARVDRYQRDVEALRARIGEITSRIKSEKGAAIKQIAASFLSLPSITRATDGREWDVFLSYPAPNREAVARLFRQLEGAFRVFMDWFCLLPGQDWQRLLPDIQRKCRCTIALISQHSQSAHFHISEIQRAINFMRQGTHQIIPVYLEDEAATPFGLEQVHSIYSSRCPGGELASSLHDSILASSVRRAIN